MRSTPQQGPWTHIGLLTIFEIIAEVKDADWRLFFHGGESCDASFTRCACREMLKQLVLREIQSALLRAAMRVASTTFEDGFEIFYRPDMLATAGVSAKISGALDTIGQYDPRRYLRMRRDLNRLIVVADAGLRVVPDLRAGTLNESFVRECSTLELAFALVEMATRARIGQRHHARLLESRYQERVWRRSTREQLAFAANLPSSMGTPLEHVKAALEQKLAASS